MVEFRDFFLKSPDFPWFSLLRTQYGHALKIPREVKQRPFARDFI